MIIYKFGGTSVGSADRIKNLSQIIGRGNHSCIVVLSAMSGTTDHLIKIAESLYQKDSKQANAHIRSLEEHYYSVVRALFETPSFIEKGEALITHHFQYLRSFTIDLFTTHEEKAILAQGELLSTALFHYFLEEQGIDSQLISALHFMRTDKDGEPDHFYIQENIKRAVSEIDHPKVIITQGFICRNAFGEIDNLRRGGSDYSATLIGAALGAEEIQIWTDIDGIHNNDPRIVDNSSSISELSFEEAAELAYFGAKILHPASLHPAKMSNIPVRLKNTLDPDARGTLITHQLQRSGIKAIAAKDHITAIKIKSGRMLLAYGFLRRIFEIFETYRTPIDMITTSEVAVSLTIDQEDHLDEIIRDISHYGLVEVDRNQSIICIVGDFIAERAGYAKTIFNVLDNIPIRMISYGGSKNNITILIDSEHKKDALIALNTILN